MSTLLGLLLIALVIWRLRKLGYLRKPTVKPPSYQLHDFISESGVEGRGGGGGTHEDADPTMNLNPVMLAKMQFDLEKERADKETHGASRRRPGALKRLRLSLAKARRSAIQSARDSGAQAAKQQTALAALDHSLARQNKKPEAAPPNEPSSKATSTHRSAVRGSGANGAITPLWWTSRRSPLQKA